MIRRYYSFAGLELCVELPEDTVFLEGRHLQAFRVDEMSADACIHFSIADVLDPPKGRLHYDDGNVMVYGDRQSEVRYYLNTDGTWQNAFSRVENCEMGCRVQLKAGAFAERVNGKVVLNALGVEHLIARAGGFLLHCSYIIRHGKAILFTAPSGTGKSTQADLWHELRGSEIVNGDRAAVSIREGIPVAQGIPFAGSSCYCENRTAPLAAIVYLGQAPETTIRRLKGYEAFSRIWEGVSVNTWDKTDMEHVSAAVSAVASQIPVFHLPCTPDESAVCVLEDALRKLESL